MKIFQMPVLLTCLFALSLAGLAHADEVSNSDKASIVKDASKNDFDAAFPESNEMSMAQIGGSFAELGVGAAAFDASRREADRVNRKLAFYDYSERKEAIATMLKNEGNNAHLLHDIERRDELLLKVANGHAASADRLELQDLEEQLASHQHEVKDLERKIKSVSKDWRRFASKAEKADLPRLGIAKVEGKLMRAAQLASVGIMAEAVSRVYLLSKARDPGYSPAITSTHVLQKLYKKNMPGAGGVDEGASTTMTSE